MKSGLSSLHYYWSMGDRIVGEFFDSMALNELFAYKFRELDGCTYDVYENRYMLPFGFTYDGYLTMDTWEELNEQEREYALLQGVLLEEEPKGYQEVTPQETVIEAAWEITAMTDVEADGLRFQAKKDGACMILKPSQSLSDCELSVTIKGLELLSNAQEISEKINWCVSYADGQKTELVSTNLMFLGLPLETGTHTIRLCYHTPGLFTGKLITLAGSAAFCLILYRYRRKIRRNRS